MVNFVIALECFSMCLIFVALMLLLNGEGAREQKLLIFIMCGSLVQNVGYLLEITAPNVEAAITAIKVENVGSAFAPLCYCWFIYIYSYTAPPKTLLRTITAVSFFMLPAVFFNWNDMYYSEVQWLENEEGFHYVSLSYGPLYAIFMVTRILIPYVLCVSTLGRAIRFKTDRAVNRQYKTIFLISSLPMLMLVVYVLKLTAVFDLTPATMAISMASVVIVIWSRRNYDFRHLAAEKVLESLGDGVITLDDHDRLIGYNHAAARVFTGLSNHRMGDNIRAVEDFREEILGEDVSSSFSANEHYYECHSKHITDENGKKLGCVILILDMTATNAYIDEIKRVRHQAEKANVAKSEFLANMSHEIRTPMNAIIGLNDLIMEECKSPQIYAHSKDVQSAAKNLLAIINDILDLSKVEAGKMELVYTDYHLKTVMDEVVSMMDMAASKRGLIMKYECDRELPCCYSGDEGRIKQIMINIINNAIKFTKEGYVRVSVTGKPSGGEDEELLTFCVEDTGCGIREKDLNKIFEDFRQVDSKRNRSVEGTGLGLAIVKHLVELMNGTINVESVYGEGTAVSITIPQKIVDRRTINELPELAPDEADTAESFTACGVKALIVDDNVINRKVARGFLKSYSLDITEAGSGQEAIELVRENRYDMIFMDHMMPVMDGIEATEIIRRDCGENGTAPVIVALTANVMEGMRERFLSSGFHDFIAKPLDRKELGQLLTRWIPEERRQTVSVGEEEKSLDPNDFQIQGIDIGVASRYYVGDKEGFINLLELYYMDGQRKKELLRELSVSDISRYCVEVHGLKSASANIGATEVSDMARAHENAASKSDSEFIEQNLTGLLETYETLLLQIGLFLDKNKKQNPVGKLPPLSKREIKEQAEEALRKLERFKSQECIGIVEELLRHELPRDAEESLWEIHGQLKLFEDDNAEELLRNFILYFN